MKRPQKVRMIVFGRTERTMLSTGSAAMEGGAELALHEIAEIDDVLFPQRPIEAELLHDEVLLLGAQRLADIGGERIARHQPEHQEQDRRDRPQHEDAVQQAPPDEGHRYGPATVAARLNLRASAPP